MLYGFDELIAFGKDNAEAMAKSSALAAKGFEEIAKTYSSFGVQSLTTAGDVAKQLSGCKSAVEFAQLQMKLTNAVVEDSMAESRKLADMTSTVFNSALEPLVARFNAVTAKAFA